MHIYNLCFLNRLEYFKIFQIFFKKIFMLDITVNLDISVLLLFFLIKEW